MPLATPTRRMPLPEQLRDFFGDLLGRQVAVDKAPDIELDDVSGLCTGVFVDDRGEIGGACIADLALACRSGAALAMIPRPVAEEAIAKGALGDNLRENFSEIANILTNQLNGPSVPHLKITELADGVPDSVRDLLIKASGRRTFRITITDYGDGALALYAR